MTRLAADLFAAGQMLTRLPLPARGPPPDASRAVWAYPLVGAAVGAVGGVVFALAGWLGLPPVVAALWAIAAQVLLTGGLHEDGLADTADGFGGGRDPAGKLAIMRDSAVGAYGVLALVLALGLRVACLAALAEPGAVLRALLAAGALGRGALLLPVLLSRPARADGLAAALHPPAVLPIAAGLTLAAGIAGAVAADGRAGVAIAVAALVGCVVARLAMGQIGGYTGDVLGAAAVGAEVSVLSVLVAGS